MIARQLTIISLIISANALSIGTVSEKHNVTKRKTNVGDLFPDWVPFKNKHGEELGEFVQVPKRKPKKRLALPVNFILRAVAEPDGDDYYDKGQGESDGDEYYEKKEWSDTNRPAASVKPKEIAHSDISDIDGVVNIITNKRTSNPVIEALKKAKVSSKDLEPKDKIDPLPQLSPAERGEPKVGDRKRQQHKQTQLQKPQKYEDEIDYEDSPTERRKPELTPEEDQSESEAKKASILDSVDELKERHQKEQVAISEKAKEEEIYKEEREREKIQAQLSVEENTDKYSDEKPKPRKSFNDYDEYDDKDVSLDKKYEIIPEKPKTTTTKKPNNPNKFKTKKDKTVETGKLSVFKNPQLYIVYDDDSEESTTVSTNPSSSSSSSETPSRRKKPGKFSAKFSSAQPSTDNEERISLVPEESESKEGEPTLFFPRKRKNKKRKSKPTPEFSVTDSSVAESKTSNKTKEVNVTDTTVSDTTIVDRTTPTKIATTDTLATNTDIVTDAVPASTHQEQKKEADYHREMGGGKEYHSEHEEEHSEEGKKAYEGVHKESKSAKGHHDKENHIGKYDDHGGVDKHHEEESGHYGTHHHEEHGKKHAKYEESGKHSKGHSTKGSHDIHKKEEYEKKVEFFEEEGDSGEEEKHGGFNEEHGHSKGGRFKNGNFQAKHEERSKGDSGHFIKGGHVLVSKGHKQAAGHDSHGKHGIRHHQKGGKEGGKKWVYHHGYPAKTANLVLIDRRTDQFYHGPQYYG